MKFWQALFCVVIALAIGASLAYQPRPDCNALFAAAQKQARTLSLCEASRSCQMSPEDLRKFQEAGTELAAKCPALGNPVSIESVKPAGVAS